MRITSLAVTDFRRYRDLAVELSPALTVIRGPNEAGKSTIQRALELALTRRCTSAAADLDALVPWDAPPGTRSTVALEFTWEDEDGVTRRGRLDKAFRGAKGTVVLDLDGELITDPAAADERLAGISGIPSEAFFRSTASVRHHELAEVQRDDAALRDRLQASISGADRGTSRARKLLERAIHQLVTQGQKNPGRLKVAQDAVAETRLKLEAGEADLARLEHDREALALAFERRTEVEAALVERRALLEKARTAERLVAERDAAQERYQRYRQAVEVHEEIQRLEASHPARHPLPVLRQAIGRLRELDRRMRELRALLEGEVAVQFDVPPEVTWRPYRRWSAVGILIGLAIIAGAVGLQLVGIPFGQLPIYVGGAVAAIGVMLGIIAVALRQADQHRARALGLRTEEISRRLRGRSELEHELRVAEADFGQQLEGIGLDGLEVAEELLAREEAHTAAIGEQRARLDGLVGGEAPDSLAGTRDAAALEIEQKTSALEALGPIAKEPRARERLEAEVADQERALERARDEEAGARARVEQNPVDAEEVAALAERLAGWQDELAVLQRRERVYRATLAAIEQAEQATMQKATRYLERRMGPMVERITAARYRRVRVDDTDLGIIVWAPEKQDWVSITELSRGTLDTIYLAARIGLVRLVTGDRRPPLILDDPFVTLDDQRAGRAFELLASLAADFQVIYLTTSDRYDAHADAVVPLPGPELVDEGAAEPVEEAAHA
ncbi:MAG TPA: AAA family ATPase [Candidatus Limnocylindrales bacterium]|nr:AAA family ATPase [Candidatus Limnocylindrales bacterium]